MDESGSIKDKDFEEEKQFIKDLANGFTNFGPNGMQMAVISYSTDAKLDIKLNQYSNKMQFINAVRKIKQFSKWIACLQLLPLREKSISAAVILYSIHS